MSGSDSNDDAMETLSLDTLLSAVMFVGARVAGLMLVAPFFGNAGIPAPIKAAFTLAVTVLLYPVGPAAHIEGGAIGWTGVVAGELIVGLLLGLAVQFVIEAAQVAGHVMGMQAGYSLATLFDPQTQADTPVMATFNQLIALLIFLQLDVHHWLLRGLAASFAYLPPGSALTHLGAAGGLLQAAGGIWLVAVQIAGPVIVATLLVDVTLGFLGKASPQMPVLLVGLPIKTLVSLVVIAGAVRVWPGLFEKHFAAAIAMGERLLHLSR